MTKESEREDVIGKEIQTRPDLLKSDRISAGSMGEGNSSRWERF